MFSVIIEIFTSAKIFYFDSFWVFLREKKIKFFLSFMRDKDKYSTIVVTCSGKIHSWIEFTYSNRFFWYIIHARTSHNFFFVVIAEFRWRWLVRWICDCIHLTSKFVFFKLLVVSSNYIYFKDFNLIYLHICKANII